MAELLPTRSVRWRAMLVATTAGVVVLGATAALAAGQLGERGFGNAFVIPVGAVTALALLALALGLLRLIGAYRDRTVWTRVRDQEGVVFSSGRTRTLPEILATYRAGSDSESPGYDVTVSCTVTGLTFWGGPAHDPVALAVIPWRDIDQIAPGRVFFDTRSSHGVHVALTSGDRLELQPLGEGMLAAFPFSTGSLRRLCDRLSAMRGRWG